MAQPRELRRRIKSVENTRKITKTMEMVATSKMKRAQDRVVAARPYAAALSEIIAELHDPGLVERFPLLRRPREGGGEGGGGGIRRAVVVGITSNRGLCGGFNNNLIKKTRARVAALEQEGAEVELQMIGRKGVGYFRYIGRRMGAEYQDITDRPTMDDAKRVIDPLMERFEAGDLDAVEIVFAKSVSAISTPPTVIRVLPVDVETAGDRQEGGAVANYILRPSAHEIVGAVLPLYVRNTMYRALVETAASEQGARRTAMKSATDNAGEMIDKLRRVYNRARQGQITQEISEIVGGAAAQQG
ncbi:MAG: ATP synthase F1 subunit gamma [Gemmatimonadetes bacterium]|nr:ATP synthase F1 subunit gamma [Gemmatimonadota bacterium]MCH8934955.1 ATP synthase F1 subunit gamma [Gemmatimonadota bacterium]